MRKSRKLFGATGKGFYGLSSLPVPRPKGGKARKAKDTLDSPPAHKRRSLLALEGEHLPPSLLMEAQANCIRFADRVDILMVNPPETPTSVLCELLLKLEQAGIDYRLTFANGKFGEQITRYLKRFLGIQLVIMKAPRDCARTLSAELAGLWGRGIGLISLKGLAVA